jgi:hypothetical protein
MIFIEPPRRGGSDETDGPLHLLSREFAVQLQEAAYRDADQVGARQENNPRVFDTSSMKPEEIAIATHHDAALRSRAGEMHCVWHPRMSDVGGGDSVYATPTEPFGNGRSHMLVEVELSRASLTALTGS